MYSVTIILVCLLYGSYAKMIFESPAELAGASILARQFIFLGPEDKINVTARVIKSDPHRGCEWSEVKNKGDWEGNIVIVERGTNYYDKYYLITWYINISYISMS